MVVVVDALRGALKVDAVVVVVAAVVVVVVVVEGGNG